MSTDGERQHHTRQLGSQPAGDPGASVQGSRPRRRRWFDYRSFTPTTMPVGEVPAGRAVGELASSVTSPPWTAKPLTTRPRPPVTNRNQPSGDRRASTAPFPLVNAVVPIRVSDPSRPMAYRDRLADPVLTTNRYRPSWLIPTQHGAVCPFGTGEVPIEVNTPVRPTWNADTVPSPGPLCALLTYTWDASVGRNSAPIWPSPCPGNGEPG